MKNDRQFRLVARLARLDQDLAEAEDALIGVSLTPTKFVRGAEVIKKLQRAREEVEGKLRRMADER